MVAVPSPTSTANSAPLSAPKNVAQVHTLSIVILVVSLFSALGALWMILGFVVSAALHCMSALRRGDVNFDMRVG